MRTTMMARCARAAALAACLAVPAARAQQDQPAPAPDQKPAAQDQQAQPAAQDQQQAPPAQEQQAQPAPEPQAQPAQPPGVPPAKNETAPVVTEQSPRPPPDTNLQPVPGAPEEYVIQRGDTLWDLSQKFLNNPWYWPKIWSNNPYIENPHWIYPGNKLRIVPGEGGAQAPAQVQAPPEQGVEATAANAPEEPANPPEAEQVAVAPPVSPDLEVVSKASKEGNAALNSVSVSGKLAFTPPPVINVRASGLVSPEEMANAGVLEASFEEKEMLSQYDTAYARFKGDAPVKPGDKLLAFHATGDIIDPVTHQKLATQTKTTAVLKVLSVRGEQATVQVERTFEEVGRGDMVRPWSAQDKRIAPKANTTEVKGVIVQAVNSDLSTIGEHHEVFIDRGTADGVQEGNTFTVVRRGDGLSEKAVTDVYNMGSARASGGEAASKVTVPEENVGLLLVVDSTEHLSTAVVIKSVRELQPGDEVEMHAAGAGGG